jgi:hypothetical protein
MRWRPSARAERRVRAACFGAPLLCLACAVAAQPLPRTPADYLVTMDRDGDKRVALSEYQDYLSRGFQQMDRDGDGRLSVAELPAGARTRRVPTLENHRRSLAATFDRQDFDNNGYLDARELAAPPQ